jgi:hypothetical protein
VRVVEGCLECGTKLIRNEKHDAYYCPECDAWRESAACDDPGCAFCVGRPEKPSRVTDGPVPTFTMEHGHAFDESGRCVRCGELHDAGGECRSEWAPRPLRR